MKTTIYHIVQFKYEPICLLHFLECNWNCMGCIRSKVLYGWNIHLSQSDKEKLNKIYSKIDKSKLMLDLDDVIKIIKESNSTKVYLTGYEPTTDPNIVEILKGLKEEGLWVKLFTNGSLLTDEIVNLVDEIALSIKAFDDRIHKFYTGASNKKTLENFEKFYNSVPIRVESIYIPGLVECDEILKIAKYIAKYNRNIPYRVNRYLSGEGYGHDATIEEVERCLENVKKILPNAFAHGYTGKITEHIGIAKCLYPKI